MFYTPQGWQCPVCGQVWSPSVLKCNCRIVYTSDGTNWRIIKDWHPDSSADSSELLHNMPRDSKTSGQP